MSQKNELKKCERELSEAKLLIFHGFWRWGAYWVMKTALKKNIPYIIVCHGFLDPYVFKNNHIILKKLWYILYGKNILKNAKYVVCATNRERSKLKGNIDKNKTVVINWPIENIKNICDLNILQGIRKSIGIGNHEKLLLSLGRLHPMKRILELVKVFSQTRIINTKLVIAGPGDNVYINSIKNIINVLGIQNKVILLGPIYNEQKQLLLQSCDGFISNSARENFGFAVAEAMSNGLPVILSSGNDLIQECENVNCGWFLKNNSSEELEKALLAFDNTSVQHLKNIGLNGKKWTETQLSFATFEKKVKVLVGNSLNNLN